MSNTLSTLENSKSEERRLDYYIQFFFVMFIVAFVIGIIWLLVAVKLF